MGDDWKVNCFGMPPTEKASTVPKVTLVNRKMPKESAFWGLSTEIHLYSIEQ